MLRHISIFLLTSLLLFSCKSSESFTQRKYLPGIFRENHSRADWNIANDNHNTIRPSTDTLPQFECPQINYEAIDESPITVNIESVVVQAVPSKLQIINAECQPTDTITKTPRQIKREARKTDAARAELAFLFARSAIIYAILLGIFGMLLKYNVIHVSGDILGLIVLVLLIIPLYLAFGLSSLLGAVFSVVLTEKVRRNNLGKQDYPEKKKISNARILAIIGFILLGLAIYLTLPALV
jgi:hypothetical protein